MADRKKVIGTVKYWVLLNIGALSLAAGVYFFKSTNNFVFGGFSGLALILENYIPNINQSLILLIMNAAVLILGFIFLGKGCTFRTVYCSIIYSLENFLFETFIPLDSPLTDQPFMELTYSVLLTGVGSAIMFNCGASSGGTDIVALILKKYTSINVGRALLFTDIIIAASSFFVFSQPAFTQVYGANYGMTAGLYSMLGLFAKAFLIDGVIEDIGKSKYVTVITNEVDKIGGYIINTMHRDYTTYVAEGGYTGNQKHVLMIVCSRPEARRLRAKAKQLDPASFIIVSDATEILGKGFRDPG